MRKAKTHGLTIVAAEDIGDRGPWDVDPEERHITRCWRRARRSKPRDLGRGDFFVVKLPMDGFVPSYNLQVAVSVLAVEALRQKLSNMPNLFIYAV